MVSSNSILHCAPSLAGFAQGTEHCIARALFDFADLGFLGRELANGMLDGITGRALWPRCHGAIWMWWLDREHINDVALPERVNILCRALASQYSLGHVVHDVVKSFSLPPQKLGVGLVAIRSVSVVLWAVVVAEQWRAFILCAEFSF